ncbi:MAG TPA: endolytic transglycosylase MltG [Rhizomicrobium sp.]|jgi:UPF0755 protein|nr:endolytic transglycosylase MltG [Rhizomicrobium sp.]
MRWLVAFVLFAAAVIGFGWFWEKYNFEQAPGPADHATVVLIDAGSGVKAIAGKLKAANVISDENLFALGVRIRGSRLKAGEYEFPAHATMAQAAEIMASGHSIQHKITAAEGLTSQMIYDLVKSDPVLVGDPGPVPDEGTLLPETYLFTRGTTRAQILAQMHAAQAKFLEEHWAGRAQPLPYGTKDEVIVLASIVEKETGIASERAHIAGVFVNRLNTGMKLQSDPTIIYGITRGYPLGRRIKESEITALTPYNTYVIPGLPSAPICNPGKDAIAAVLNPQTTEDVFFVANGTGGHAFAKTVDEQNRNVAAWRKIHIPQK